MNNKLLRLIYRIILLIGIFLISLNYFSKGIKEVVFDIDNTTVMENVTFPLVTLKVEENEINLLHGYSSNINANKMRESITPLNREKEFEVVINQQDYVIKKLNYEVREFVGNELVEKDSISVFEEEDQHIIAKVKLNADLVEGKEYAVKLSLVTNESKKMYYYTRIKVFANSYLEEKLDYILDFHNALKDKKAAEEIRKYLEPKAGDNTSFSYVNIHSDFDLITWGDLNPEFLTKIVPTIKEIYSDIALVELKYYVNINLEEIQETYLIKEFYRVRYSPQRMYLLDYERFMEAYFDVNLASLSKSELKLGITSDYEMEYLVSPDKNKLAFVRNRELWFYNLKDNEMVRVFSFRQEESDYIRDTYDQHDIRILDMDAEGNINFVVYGYMNRGQYEGRVALILYHYVRSENRIEEMVYIPVEEPYQILKEDINDIFYLNAKDVFYFSIYNNIYAYNLITRELEEIATNIYKDYLITIPEMNCIAWQSDSDPKLASSIYVLNLEKEEIDQISAPDGYNILLLDKIDSNLIYGYVAKGDIIQTYDKGELTPLSVVNISTVKNEILKSYEESGYYITDIEVNENIVTLHRVQKTSDNGSTVFVPSKEDYIMNQIKEVTPFVRVTSRVTEKALTEAYLTLPSGFIMDGVPRVLTTVNAVINQDPTVRLEVTNQPPLQYYPYVFDQVKGSYKDASEAIRIANEGIGVVLNNRKQLVWERGVKATKKTISWFEDVEWSVAAEGKSIPIIIKLMLEYQGIKMETNQIHSMNEAIYEFLLDHSKYEPIRLTGCSLDEVLYYVSLGRPVIAYTSRRDAVLIVGYDNFNILMIDPVKNNKIVKKGIQDSTQMFEEAGNVFISYLE